MNEVPQFFQFLASMGVGGILAGFIFSVHNRTLKEHAEVIKGYHETEKGRTDMLVTVIRQVSENIVRNTVVTESLHRRLDTETKNVSPK